MTTYPVQYLVTRPPRYTRLMLAVRVVAAIALGVVGISFGAIALIAFLGLPVFATIRLSSRGPEDYQRDDGRRVVALLRWYAAILGWFSLVHERWPSRPEDVVELDVAPTGRPAPGSALARVITGLPSAIVLALLWWIGAFVWLWAALSVLIAERVGPGAYGYLEGLQRWTVRLWAYQASLVAEYPPFSFEETDAGALTPRAGSSAP